MAHTNTHIYTHTLHIRYWYMHVWTYVFYTWHTDGSNYKNDIYVLEAEGLEQQDPDEVCARVCMYVCMYVCIL